MATPCSRRSGRRGRREARREVRGHRPRGRRGARREPARAPRRRGALRLLVGPGGDPSRRRPPGAVRRGDPRAAGAAAHGRDRARRRRGGRGPGRVPRRRAEPGRPTVRPGTRRRDPGVTRGHAPRTADRRRPLRGSRLADVQRDLGPGRGRSCRARRRRSDGAAAAVRARTAAAAAVPGVDGRSPSRSCSSSRSSRSRSRCCRRATAAGGGHRDELGRAHERGGRQPRVRDRARRAPGASAIGFGSLWVAQPDRGVGDTTGPAGRFDQRHDPRRHLPVRASRSARARCG